MCAEWAITVGMTITVPAKRVPPSVTGGIRDRIKALSAAGQAIDRLDAGEVDFTSPDVRTPSPTEIADLLNPYGPPLGLAGLREAIVQTRGAFPAGLTVDDILVTNGAKQAVYLALAVLAPPGADVLVPAPHWVSYLPMLEMTGGRAVVVPADRSQSFKVTPEALERAVTPSTTAVVINTPGNPSGSVYTRDELEAIATWANERGLWILSDEIYRHIYFGEGGSAPSIAETTAERFVIVDGLSKAYALAGWRVGWLIAEKSVLGPAKSVMSHTTSHASNYPQLVAERALRDSTYLPLVRHELRERRDALVSAIHNAGLDCVEPQGSIYTFPSIESLYGRSLGGIDIVDDLSASEALLAGGGIASVPGSAFGAPGHLRLGYGRNLAEITAAGERLIETLR